MTAGTSPPGLDQGHPDGATAPRDWDERLARRTHTLGGSEITAILALAGATDVITFSGGFPEPATFSTGALADIAARLIAQVGAPLGPLVAGLLLGAFSTRLTCLVITAWYAAIALWATATAEADPRHRAWVDPG